MVNLKSAKLNETRIFQLLVPILFLLIQDTQGTREKHGLVVGQLTFTHSHHAGDKLDDSSSPQEEAKWRRYPKWPSNIIEGVTDFTARIGPTGDEQGYSLNNAWGIAWYINDQLLPEIVVERGETYYFLVEGGEDSRNRRHYHPLYITDSEEGGFGQKNESEQRSQQVYVGVRYDSGGYPYPTAAGRLCQWEHKTVDKSSTSETFLDFFKTLKLVCEVGRPTLISWTVPMSAPDILYYQCYSHNNLGWKLHVVNEGERIKTLNSSPATLSSLFLIFSSFLLANNVI